MILNPRFETVVKKLISYKRKLSRHKHFRRYNSCPSIVKVINEDYAPTTILNSSEKRVKIDHFEIFLEPLPSNENKSVSVNTKVEQNSLSTGLDKISSLLRTDHLSEEERSLIDICLECKYIFHSWR